MYPFYLELELVKPVSDYFIKQGYLVRNEIRIGYCRADLVAFKKNEVIAIELKFSDWKKGIIQAKNYQLGADFVYLAVPLFKSYKFLRKAEHYMKKTRLEELILYAKKMNYKRLGLAFCLGLEKEAKIVNEILEKHFEMHSVCCKIGGIDKKSLELERLHDYEGVEAMCNPIGQAYVLNRENCDLNIILGLCMGHDTLFTKYSKAPVTTLAVKDRVLAHNPLGAIYSGYYLRKRFKED